MKRFTDTAKWQKPWFRKLEPEEKVAWYYITENCDSVGVWDADFELADFFIGESIDWQSLIKKSNGNIEELDNDKWFLPGFCDFQYGKLTINSRPHQCYMRLLKKHGLESRVLMDTGPVVQTPKRIRKRVTKILKNEIYARDKYLCQYCGKHQNIDGLVIEHMVPVTRGGTNDEDNLVAACNECNTKKGNRDLVEFLETEDRVSKILDRVSKVYQSLKEKEKEKEQVKDKVKDKEREYAPTVSMTEKEYTDMCARFSKKVVDEYIERISDWQLSTGKQRKDMPATIKNWMRRDKEVGSVAELEIRGPPKCPKCGKPLTNEIKNGVKRCYSCDTEFG